MKNRKMIIGSMIASAGLVATAIGLTVMSNAKPFNLLKADNEYTLTLNYSNGGSSFGNSYSSSENTNTAARTTSGYEIDFKYYNAKSVSSYYVDLSGTSSGAGYIYNSTRISGIESITVSFSGSLTLYISDTSSFGSTGTSITSGSKVDIEAANFFKLLNTSSSATQIQSIVVTYSCVAASSATYTMSIDSSDTGNNDVHWTSSSTSSLTHDGITWSTSVTGTTSVTAQPNYAQLGSKKNPATKVSLSTTGFGGMTIKKATLTGYCSSNTGPALTITAGSSTMLDSEALIKTTSTTYESTNNNITLAENGALTFEINSSAQAAICISEITVTYVSSSTPSGGDDPTPIGPTTDSLTITKSNSGIGTSSLTSAKQKSYAVTSGNVVLEWSAGCFDYGNYDEIGVGKNGGYMKVVSLPDGYTISTVVLDFFQYENAKVYSGTYNTGTELTAKSTSSSGSYSSVLNTYDVNDTSFYILNDAGYNQAFYSITINFDISTDPVSAESVSLNKNALALYTGDSESLVATVSPNNATDKSVTWTSSVPSVATVDASGMVNALAVGSTTITVTTTDGGFTATCTVTVSAKIAVTSVSLNTGAVSINKNASTTLTATVYPSNATNKNVTWSSSNTGIATVSNGVVTGVAAGTATITVTTVDGSKTATCTVTVNPTHASSISISEATLSLKVGQTSLLTASITPADADDKAVVWSTNDATVATIDNGTVTAVGAGTATITAASHDNSDLKATCIVTVEESTTPVAGTEFELVESDSDLSAGDLVVIGCSTKSAAAGSLNSSYLTSVSGSFSNGKVTLTDEMMVFEVGTSASGYTFSTEDGLLGYESLNLKIGQGTTTWSVSISSGEATIGDGSNYIRYNNNSPRFKMYASTSGGMSEVELYKQSGKVNSVSLDASDIGINVGNTYALTATVSPASALNKEVSWASNNTAVATVNTEGLVTAVSAGTATITVTTADGNKTASCLITVSTGSTILPREVTLDQNTLALAVDQTSTLHTTVKPTNVDNSSITWTSSNTSVATVSSSGVVTGKAEGTATITAKTVNNKQATCTVSVTEVALDEWTLMFYICGSNLESDTDGGAATDDLNEILQVRSQQPDTVNIAVETGGASSWQMSGVSSSKLGRWEINSSSNKMISKGNIADASMGEASTLQSFLEWGITTYPAKKYGLFMWNHGGAMDGCCFDENHDDDGLYSNEVHAGVSAARNTCNITGNLEFIAYDACLMAVQDVAEMNSLDFNYMICSQETEWSGGYDYDAWLPTLYNNPATVSTQTVLTKVGDTFMDYYEKAGYYDQTQSVLDLSKMAAYKTAWEDMTQSLTSIVNSSSKWSTFAGYINQALKYGYNDESYAVQYNNGYAYDVFDVKGAINKLKAASEYSSMSSKFTAVLNALNDVVIYNRYGSNASVRGSCGLCLFCPISGYNQINDATWDKIYYEANYDSTRTNFTKWQAFVARYGNWAA